MRRERWDKSGKPSDDEKDSEADGSSLDPKRSHIAMTYRLRAISRLVQSRRSRAAQRRGMRIKRFMPPETYLEGDRSQKLNGPFPCATVKGRCRRSSSIRSSHYRGERTNLARP